MTEHAEAPGLEPGLVPFRPSDRAETAPNPGGAAPRGFADDPEDVVDDDLPEDSLDDASDELEAESDAEGGDEPPFAELPTPLRVALESRGFQSFTPVQRAVLDAVGEGCDLRISSQTGSGKTVALGFAMASDVLADAAGPAEGARETGLSVARPTRNQRGPVALVIVPTRELAAQVAEELSWLFAEVPGASVDVVTGGTSVLFERRRLARSPRILVGTPGRLVDHTESGALRLDAVRQLVLDEADQMLDMGFRDELEAILERTPPERHTHLVSATFPDAIQRLAERYQRAPRMVEGSRLGAVNADIAHIAHLVRPDQRYDLLVNHLLLSGGERTLVFVNTRAETGELSARLAEDGFGAQPLSGELQQAQRTRTLAAFRAGTAPVLVATDVAARGLDVPDVALVVHTAVPIDSETYIHRSGRTGRAGQQGKSILMVTPNKERRATRMLADASIKLDWQAVPKGRDVQAALDARAKAALAARLEAAAADVSSLTPATRALARELLAGRDAELVVAALLPGAVTAPPTAPRALEDALLPRALEDRRRLGSPRGGRPEPGGRYGRYDRGDGYGRSEPYGRGGRPGRDAYAPAPSHGPAFGAGERFRAPEDRPQHSRDGFLRGEDRRGPAPERATEGHDGPRPRGGQGFVRFRVNWGYQGGANPRRLLATLCRRGGVTNREIGSIDIGPTFSTFEVASYAAGDFAGRAGQDDPRDPGLWVAPDEPARGGYPRGPRRG